MEAAYTTAIEKRTADILEKLALKDEAKSVRVHDIVITQYRTLRARDAAIDSLLTAHGKTFAGTDADRESAYQSLSRPLHRSFLGKLATELSPEQIEVVKDRMTYDKVKVTYDAYCAIVPGLTDRDKTKILELLKAAREEAIDGGSSKQKTDIFQKYKEQINADLKARGHDLDKAFKDFAAKQEMAKAQDASAPPAAPAKN
jgi:type I site-specific restriction-modification system R (restriction) subunit